LRRLFCALIAQKQPAPKIQLSKALCSFGERMKKLLTGILSVLGLVSTLSQADETKATSKDLREMVFSLKASDIGINKENFPFPVWGTIMESGFPDSDYFTLVVLADGAVSFYLSNGGGIIGAGTHEKVREPAGKFLIGSKDFYGNAKLVTDYLSPEPNQVIFYFLTDGGVLKYSAQEEVLGENKDKLSSLFHAGHAVITELRKVQGD
jgi:hypothetical protein